MSAYLKVIGSGAAPFPGPYAEFPPSRPPDSISKGDAVDFNRYMSFQLSLHLSCIYIRAPQARLRLPARV